MTVSNLRTSNMVTIPTSIGDLIDRITILTLKSKRIKNATQLNNINTELNLLVTSYNDIKQYISNQSEINKLHDKLMDINTQLWDYEDLIRQQLLDVEIAKTAKAIITTNDQRSIIKYAINSLLNSYIIEEKSYTHG